MKQLKIRLYRNLSKLNRQSIFIIPFEYIRTQVERKQADDSEPIQTSRVVTDEVKKTKVSI
jgi:hypothetical protein